ncbi:MAG: outer membrane lipoprotein carrier protein LolA [Bdellovibrionota bacterium]
MHKVFFCLLIFNFFTLDYNALAKDLTIQDLKKIQSKLKEADSLTVDFEQDNYTALRNRHKISKGIAYFHKPESFRWAFSEPNRIEWIYDGKSFIKYFPNEKKGEKFSVGSNQGDEYRQIVDMVMNIETLLAKYDMIKAEQLEQVVLVRLNPKNKDGEITSVNLTIDLKKQFVSSVKLFFRGKNHTMVTFMSPRREKLGKNIFMAPKDVKIIKVL